MAKLLYVLLYALSSLAIVDCNAVRKGTICAYSDSGFVKKSNSGPSAGVVSADNKTITCWQEDNAGCFTYWNDSIILKQGCWVCDDNSDCRGPECISTVDVADKFCKCTGYLCNANFSDGYNASLAKTLREPDAIPASHHLQEGNSNSTIIVIAIASVLGVAVVVIVVFFVYRMCSMSHRQIPETSTLIEAPPPQPTFETDDLKLSSIISKGRYGEVWRGLLNDTEVAVKVFSHGQKQYFTNERDIYSLPHLEHNAIVKCFGAEERISIDGNPEYILVLSYTPLGSLHSYLKNNILDWAGLCKMARSIAQGLAHMHADIHQGERFKPAVAHRDFNTRNVLVKPDLTCCITDMGFAIKIMGSKFIRNGQEENAEQSSLSDVGTLRYMAPEVLDGAVNLRDCESSMKQIDVYSLGLVLWELTTRTKDLYPGSVVPEYTLPYQAEIGLHPAFDEMQQLVSKNKERPSLPNICHAVNSTQPHLQAIRALKETIEDCWDQDAEARLTALCVEERIIEMSSLWDSRSKGVTPTAINLTLSQPTTTTDSVVDTTTTHTVDRQETFPALSRSQSDGDEALLGQYTRMPRQRESLSTLTVETVLSPSYDGSERSDTVAPTVCIKENVNLKYELAQKALQPHQGRNPTVERNTHKKSEEELAVFGNTLMDAKLAAKHNAEKVKLLQQQQQLQQQQRRRGNRNADRGGASDDGYDNAEGALMQNDVLSHHRNAPIPYLQNQVHEPSPPAARPKVANVPGNGSLHGGMTVNEAKVHVKTRNTTKAKKNKDKGGIFGFLSKNFKSHSNQNLDSSAPCSSSTNHNRSNSDGQSVILGKRNVNREEQRPLMTEVRVVNGCPVVRPAILNVNDSNATGSCEPQLGVAEVGVAKLQPARLHNGLPASIKERDNRAHSETDLSPSGLSAANKAVRPSSLRLKGHNYKSDPQINRNGGSKKDLLQNGGRIQRRVKTPRVNGDGANRLSLHNESSEADSYPSKSSSAVGLNKTGQSLINLDDTELNTMN